MAALRAAKHYTHQEYLELEKRAEFKSEYHDGMIVAMAGASPEQDQIVFDLAGELTPQLRVTPCRGFSNDQRVRVPDCNKYYYPDTTIVCGEPEYENIVGVRSLRNPTVVFEVLSGPTERVGRTEKYDCCRTLYSLTTYVLIAQDSPRIENFTRLPDGNWRHVVAKGLDGELALDAIGCTLRLANLYDHISFPPAPGHNAPDAGAANGETTP